MSLFSGKAADPPSDDFIMRNSANAQQIEVGWWPGDSRHPRAAFFAFVYPAPDQIGAANFSSSAGRWDEELKEYLLDWDDARAAPDPYGAALEFGRSVIKEACTVCGWDPALAASAQGITPPVT